MAAERTTEPAFASSGAGALGARRALRGAVCGRRARGARMAAGAAGTAGAAGAASRAAPGVAAAPGAAEAGLPTRAPESLGVFRAFFHAMGGSWNSERTYHYVRERRREESQTTFDVSRLGRHGVDAVLAANGESAVFSPQEAAYAEGFCVSFLTRMPSAPALVRAATNLVFVPRAVAAASAAGAGGGGGAAAVEGDYYRDLGYEERAPVAATFAFDPRARELTMTTYYSKVVSVDQITLVNANVRLRKIVNYARPREDGAPLVEPVLVGFGVECKGEDTRLVQDQWKR